MTMKARVDMDKLKNGGFNKAFLDRKAHYYFQSENSNSIYERLCDDTISINEFPMQYYNYPKQDVCQKCLKKIESEG